MARLLTDKEMMNAALRWVVALVAGICGYVILIIHAGWWATFGIFLIHLAINFGQSAEKIVDKLKD